MLMERKPCWVKGESFTRSEVLRIAAPAAKVFPLLCPVLEYDWIPDWSCVMVWSKSGVAEKGAVFTTVEKPFLKMLWTCSVYEPPKRIEYVFTHGSKISIILEGDLKDVGEGCELLWTMTFTAASPFFARLLKRRMSEKTFDAMMEARKRQFAEYFAKR
jgi:hypothetical protein